MRSCEFGFCVDFDWLFCVLLFRLVCCYLVTRLFISILMVLLGCFCLSLLILLVTYLNLGRLFGCTFYIVRLLVGLFWFGYCGSL